MDAVMRDFLAALDPAETFRDAFGADPLDWQREYLNEHRDLVTLKGRQVGATQAAACLCVHEAVYRPGSLSAVVAPSLRQAGEITTRAREGLRTLGETLIQDSASLLRLRNGSRILSLPGSPRSVRGWSASLLICDEAAYLPAETFVAARALVATGGRLIVQSTPAEAQGLFHDLWTTAGPEWARMKVRSDEVPTISARFLADAQRSMSPDQFAMEFLAEFGHTGASLFDAARLADLVLEDEAPYAPIYKEETP